MNQVEKISIYDFIKEFSHLFTTDIGQLGCSNSFRHKIKTGDALPIKQHPYRTSVKEKNIISEATRELLEAGIIEKSCSPWSSPVVLIPKKDGGHRMCIDYRKLNNVTKKDSYRSPRIDDAFDTLAGSKYFTSLDLLSGYFQLGIDEND